MSVEALLRLVQRNSEGNRFRLVRRRRACSGPGRRQTFVPRLEFLEDRWAPAVLIVNTLADETTTDSTLSLREAISVVDSGSTAGLSSAEQAQVSGTLGQNDTIQFAASLAGGTITLISGQLAITRDVNIAGPGASQLTISGNSASRIFDNSNNANVSIAGLTLTRGLVTEDAGGAISNEFDANVHLNLSGCTLTGNQAGPPFSFVGGALYNNFGNTANVSNCTFTANQVIALDNIGPEAASECEGGAIDNDGTMTVTNSVFTGNQAIAGSTSHVDRVTEANAGAIANDGTLDR